MTFADAQGATDETSPTSVSPPAPAPGGRRRALLAAAVAGGVVLLLVVLYVLDLLLSRGEVPRGVAVGGVDIGGTTPAVAEATLRRELGPRATRPVAVRAGDTDAVLDPADAGLGVDWAATVARAGEQPRNPFTRLGSLVGTRDVPPVTTGDPADVGRAVGALRPRVDRGPVEGTVAFRGAEPVAVPARPGQSLDAPAATTAVLEHWLDPQPVALPVEVAPTTVTAEGIDTAIRTVARPATAAPFVLVGDGQNATLDPAGVGTVLRFDPDGRGGLVPRVDADALRAVAGGPLGPTEAEGSDARVRVPVDTPVVVPAVEGRRVDWARTGAAVVPALARPADGTAPPTFVPPPRAPGAPPAEPPPVAGRGAAVAYTTTPPQRTTEQVAPLATATVIGEFQTGGFATDSGRNIRRVAEQVDGAIVLPGATFSLNGFTGPRDAAQGYVEAGIIQDGVPDRGIGGGISQFATTLYNAEYFAGMVDVEHQEHSYWISRYPAGREATVFEGAIDLRFRNDGPTPVLIDTQWTPSTIRVRLFGQKRFDVTSAQGPRTDPTPAPTRDLSSNPKCKPATGVPGFTITDTRTLRDVATGEVRTQPRTVVYDPEPTVTCGGA